MDSSAMAANEVHTMNAAPLAPAEGLDGRSKTIIEKSKTAHLSTAEVSYLLGQAQHWKNNGALEGLICTGRPASPPGEWRICLCMQLSGTAHVLLLV